MSDEKQAFIKRSREAAWIYPNFTLYSPDGELVEAAWPTLNDWVALDLSGNTLVHGGLISDTDVIEAVERLSGIKSCAWSTPWFVPKSIRKYYKPLREKLLKDNAEILRDIFDVSFAEWPSVKKKECESGVSDESTAIAVGLVPIISTQLVSITGLNILQIANLPIRCVSQLLRIKNNDLDAPEANKWVADMLEKFENERKKKV